jgi:undecaprenyl-diphosphatase
MLILPTRSRLAASPLVAPLFRVGFVVSGSVSRSAVMALLLLAGLALAASTSLVSQNAFDEPVLEAIQGALPSWYEPVGDFCNVFLRDTLTPLLWAATILGFLYLRRNDLAGLFVLAALNGPFTMLLKETVDRPRPAGDFTVLEFPTDPSFPSGHTMTALAFFGLWFIVAPRVLPAWAVLPVRAFSAAAIFFTGLSRIWAGAHWPSDVLGSFIWGSLFLMLVLATQPLLGRLNPARQSHASPAL